MSDRDWVIRKNGAFYRPDFCGYTIEIMAAGRYTKLQAEQERDNEPKSITIHLFRDAVAERYTPERLQRELRALQDIAEVLSAGTGRDELSRWFGLSYATFSVLPRVLMEAMPDEWQSRMAVLLNEYEAAFPNRPDIGTRVQCTRDGKLSRFPDWLLNYRHPDRAAIDEVRTPQRAVSGS